MFPHWTSFKVSCNFGQISGLITGVRAMPQFSYKARRKSGEVVQGVLEVADRAAALVQIERLGLFPVMVEGARGATAAAAAAARRRKSRTFPSASVHEAQAHAAPKTSGTCDLHATARQLAQLRHAADRGAEFHDASGIERHSGGHQQDAQTGSHGRPLALRFDGQATNRFLRPLHQHGARG